MKKMILASISLCLLAPMAQAQKAFEAGDWILRAGATVVDPDSSGLVADGVTIAAEEAASLTFNIEYLFADSWGVELLAAVPFKHDIEASVADEGTAEIGSTRQLPPTLTLKWHPSIGRIAPYIGVGVNWTIFYDEKITDDAAVLGLDDSLGVAAQAGFDWVFGNNWLVNLDVRYIQIETDAIVGSEDGVESVGTIDINPWVYGINFGYKF